VSLVRIANDVDNQPDAASGGSFAELIRLQTEFQARLAEETLRYLRRLQGAVGPSVPGTVVLAEASLQLKASGSPGDAVELRLEVENRQRVHCVAMPALSPLLDDGGATWFPAADTSPPAVLLAPGEVGSVSVQVKLPNDLPHGTYRGALVLPGFRDRGIPVAITVTDPSAPPSVRSPRQRRGSRVRTTRPATRPRPDQA
jgi:hypothetical protein